MFNISLYKEGLRRSMFPALLFIAVMLIGAILMPVGQIQGAMRAAANGWDRGHFMVANITNLNFTLMLSMIAMAPILTLFQFSFLNKRNGADFYHALPHKRAGLYLSFLLATLTWILGALWVLAGLSLLILAPFSSYVAVNMTAVIQALLHLSAGSLLVSATVMLAMSVTGIVFANIIAAGLLLFLPRTILTAFSYLVVGRLPFLPIESLGLIGTYSNHIPFGLLLGAMSQDTATSLVPAIIYSTVLAILYFVLACVLFVKRPSEMAGNPALNRKVQALVRVAGAFLLCLPATAILVSNTSRGLHTSDFFVLAGVYAFAVLCYFAYELITTRTWKNLLRILPGLGVLLVVNILFSVGVTQTTNHFLRQELPAQNVESVRIVSFNENSWPGQTPSYATLRTREVQITDPAIVSFLTDALARQQYEIRENISVFEPSSHFTRGWSLAIAEFTTTSGSTVLRNVWIPFTTQNDFADLLSQNTQYREAFLLMPENPTILWSRDLEDEEALREVYVSLREEMTQVDPALALLVQSNVWDMDISFYGSLNISGFVGNERFSSSYNVTTLTPSTASLFKSHVNNENLEMAKEILESDTFFRDGGHLSVFNFTAPESHHLNFWDSRPGSDLELLTLIQVALAQENAGLDQADKPLFMLSFSGSILLDENNWSWHQGAVFFRWDNEEFLEAFMVAEDF